MSNYTIIIQFGERQEREEENEEEGERGDGDDGGKKVEKGLYFIFFLIENCFVSSRHDLAIVYYLNICGSFIHI